MNPAGGRWRAVGLLLVSGMMGLGAAAPGAAAPLTPAQARGKQIYTTGISADGRAFDAEIIGGVIVPASHQACVQCHGTGGLGRNEGGVPVPDIRWHRLSAAQGLTTAYGDHRPPYDETSVGVAIRQGMDAAGDPLYGMMPRFVLGDADLADVVAYLQVLGNEGTPGTTDDVVRVAVLAPDDGGQGSAASALLQRYFARPGTPTLHARRVEIVVRDPGPTAQTALAVARELVDGSAPVFCFLANSGLGADPVVMRFLEQRKVPVLGPLTMARGAPRRGTVFYFLASPDDRARAAARFLAGEPALVTGVLHGDTETARAMRYAFLSEARRQALRPMVEEQYDGADPAAWVVRLQTAGVERLVLFGSAAWAQPLLDAGATVGFEPHVVASSSQLAGVVKAAGNITLIMPAVAATAGGNDPLAALVSAGRENAELAALVAAHQTMSRAALAAAEVLVAGLADAGRRLSRRGLVEALAGLRNFETGMMPPVVFGPNRRVGVRGALLTTIDTTAGRVVSSQWVDVAESDAAPAERPPRVAGAPSRRPQSSPQDIE